MNAPRPANVAYVDAEMVDAAATLDEMVESYRRGSVEFNVDAAARYLLMSRATVDTYDHFEAAKLLAVAVARLGDQPTPPAFLTVPAGPHAVSTVAAGPDGLVTAVCVCTAVFTDDDEDLAVSKFDAHIAEEARRSVQIGDIARGEILAWLSAEPRHFNDVMGMLWCATVTEVGGKPVEVELLDGSRLILVDGAWLPQAGA